MTAPAPTVRPGAPHGGARRARSLGYQPGLDGMRAISVLAVMAYHAGFGWMRGGFFGVEVFFVVSGYLITVLLIEERQRSGRNDLRHFWVRRWRRLLPALFVMLLVISVWALLAGSPEQQSQMRRDLPWGIGYLANWGQIFSRVAYFSGTPTLLRHLWSLAIEEQWYLVWPVVFVALRRRGGSADHQRARWLATASATMMVFTAVCYLTRWPTRLFNPFAGRMMAVDPINVLYLSTLTRSSGLLAGAALAFGWRPWARRRQLAVDRRILEGVAAGAGFVVLVGFVVGDLTAGSTYLGLLPAVTVASTLAVASVVHPRAVVTRRVLSWRPLVVIGQRSYGLYLWSWPISRIVDAYHGSVARFVLAMVITVPVNEAAYRLVETPMRRGLLGRLWQRWRERDPLSRPAAVATAAIGALVVISVVAFARVPTVYDAALDRGADVEFEAPGIRDGGRPLVTQPGAPSGTGPSAPGTTGSEASGVPTSGVASGDPTGDSPDSTATPTTASAAIAPLPRRVVVVGDSTAHSLVINTPRGIASTMVITDGSLDGCSVYTDGAAISARGNFRRSFSGCAQFASRWADAARRSQAQVALVSIGAWDVFDEVVDGATIRFGSAESDRRFDAGVQAGIDAIVATGARVALLEVPCMRPVDVDGAGVPALPERGDDARVAHVNELLRAIAARQPGTTTFIPGPAEYCSEPIASDRGYRWDGVHAYKPGAKLTFETISERVISIPLG